MMYSRTSGKNIRCNSAVVSNVVHRFVTFVCGHATTHNMRVTTNLPSQTCHKPAYSAQLYMKTFFITPRPPSFFIDNIMTLIVVIAVAIMRIILFLLFHR